MPNDVTKLGNRSEATATPAKINIYSPFSDLLSCWARVGI